MAVKSQQLWEVADQVFKMGCLGEFWAQGVLILPGFPVTESDPGFFTSTNPLVNKK